MVTSLRWFSEQGSESVFFAFLLALGPFDAENVCWEWSRPKKPVYPVSLVSNSGFLKFFDLGFRALNDPRKTIYIGVYRCSVGFSSSDWLAKRSRSKISRFWKFHNFPVYSEKNMLVTNPFLLLQVALNVITKRGNRLSMVSYRCTAGILAVFLFNGQNREFLKIVCNSSSEHARMVNLVSSTLREHFLYWMVLSHVEI